MKIFPQFCFPRFCAATSCLLITLAVASKAHSQDEILATKLHEQINAFFENLNDEQVAPEMAFADLLAEGPLAGNENVTNLILRFAEVKDKYGRYLEHEQIDARLVGKDLAMFKYLYKAERFPVVWYFTFYRPPIASGGDNQWMIIAVRFDTRLELLGL